MKRSASGVCGFFKGLFSRLVLVLTLPVIFMFIFIVQAVRIDRGFGFSLGVYICGFGMGCLFLIWG
jgi:hypothetical protein